MKKLAIIPARGGSKGLKDKNIRPLGDKPLIRHTIDHAIESNLFDRIVVTTESPKIASVCQDVEVIRRDPSLAKDEVILSPVILNAFKKIEERDQTTYDLIFTLQPTSPLRTAKDIENAWKRLVLMDADSLISVTEEQHSLWGIENGEVVELYKPDTNRQWAVRYFIGNGAIFITKRNILIENEDRLSGRIAIYVMNNINSIDIHSIDDIDLAEYYLRRN